MDWIKCNNCEKEFRVICDSNTPTEFCPFCGEIHGHEHDEIVEDYDE